MFYTYLSSNVHKRKIREIKKQGTKLNIWKSCTFLSAVFGEKRRKQFDETIVTETKRLKVH